MPHIGYEFGKPQSLGSLDPEFFDNIRSSFEGLGGEAAFGTVDLTVKKDDGFSLNRNTYSYPEIARELRPLTRLLLASLPYAPDELHHRVDIRDVGDPTVVQALAWHPDFSTPKPVAIISKGPSSEVLCAKGDAASPETQEQVSHLLLHPSERRQEKGYSELDDLTEADLDKLGLIIHRATDHSAELMTAKHLHRRPRGTKVPQPRTWVRTFVS